MNAAIPQRRPATEEIPVLIERVTFHNDDRGKNQGADAVLESWEDMNHDFQIFGPDASQSADALRRFGEVINARGRGREKKGNYFVLNGRQDLDRQALTCRFGGTWNRFGPANRLFVQLPLMNGFLTSFSRQIRIQLSLRFIEGVFRSHSGPVSCVIRLFHLLREESNLRIDGLRFRFALPAGLSAACFRHRRFVGGFHLTAPARLNRFVQFVQGSIGLVCGLSYSALFKEPPENRPLHGLSHERLSLFDFGELSHGAPTIARHSGKVQRDGGVVSPRKAIAISI